MDTYVVKVGLSHNPHGVSSTIHNSLSNCCLCWLHDVLARDDSGPFAGLERDGWEGMKFG